MKACIALAILAAWVASTYSNSETTTADTWQDYNPEPTTVDSWHYSDPESSTTNSWQYSTSTPTPADSWLYSSPEPTSADNWQAVAAKIEEIEAIFSTTIRQIKHVANENNRQAGTRISSQLDVAANISATTIFVPVAAEVCSQTFTKIKAQLFVGQLTGLIHQVQNHLKKDLARLSDDAKSHILMMLHSSSANAKEFAKQLYDLLDTITVNRKAVGGKMCSGSASVTNTSSWVIALIGICINKILLGN